MSEENFKAWAAQTVRDQDAAIEQLKAGLDAALAAQVIEQLQEDLNKT